MSASGVAAAEALARRAAEAERAGNPRLAIELLREARRMAPRDGRIAHRFGVALLRGGDQVEAIAALRGAVGFLPREAGPVHDLGLALLMQGSFREAAQMFERGAALDPGRALHLIRQAGALERLHDLAGAHRALDRALALEPTNTEAWTLRAELQVRTGAPEDALAMIDRLPIASMPAAMAARALIARCRALERMGDADGAFAAAARSHEILLQTPEARAALATPIDGLMRETLAEATGEMLARWRAEAPPDEPRVVWLVGMPRSGTTVVEQVLASIRGVASNDERSRASIVYQALVEETGPAPRSVIARLDALTPEAVVRLRGLFHAEIVRSTPGGASARVVVDKQPMRIMDVALVSRLFPRSKMVVMVRDPRDVCLSALMQTFNPRPVMSRFLTPESAGRLCADVMLFWRAMRPIAPFDALEVRYERFVRDFEAGARELVEFLGLEWTDEIHRFHESARERGVRSASYQAVTSGITDRSVGKWRAYRAHLGAVIEAVRPVVEAYGYDPE